LAILNLASAVPLDKALNSQQVGQYEFKLSF